MALDIDENEFENADVMAGFKVTKTERAALQAEADRLKTTVSKLVRYMVVNALGINKK